MLPFHGKYPKLDPKSCVMPGAELAGDVELKEYASIWQNCALRGDVNKIVVGRYSNVQDNSVLHVDDDKACILGDYVTIGHGAIVHASTIEDNVLVGMGAIVLSGCHVGSGSIIGRKYDMLRSNFTTNLAPSRTNLAEIILPQA